MVPSLQILVSSSHHIPTRPGWGPVSVIRPGTTVLRNYASLTAAQTEAARAHQTKRTCEVRTWSCKSVPWYVQHSAPSSTAVVVLQTSARIGKRDRPCKAGRIDHTESFRTCPSHADPGKDIINFRQLLFHYKIRPSLSECGHKRLSCQLAITCSKEPLMRLPIALPAQSGKVSCRTS